MTPRERNTIIAVAIWLLGIVLLTWYLSTAQAAGDRTLAANALRDASIRSAAASFTSAGSSSTVPAGKYIVSAEGVDLYLVSQTAVRNPLLTSHFIRFDLSLDAAYELARLAETGRATPRVGEAPDVAAAVKAFPELASLTKDGPSGPTIDNTGNKAAAALGRIGATELELANQEAARTWGPQ